MNLKRIGKSLRELGRSSAGDARSFQRFVILPQVFVFIAYISLGAALREPSAATIFKLAIVVYLLIVNMLVQSALRRYSVRLLSFHLVALSLLLGSSCLILGQQPLLGVFTPISIILLLLVFIPLSWSATVMICAWSGVVLGAFWLVELTVHHRVWEQSTHGPLLVCLSYFVLLVRALVRRPSQRGAQEMSSMRGSMRVEGRPSSAAFSGDPGGLPDPRTDIKAIFTEELRSDYLWKLPAISLLFAALAFGSIGGADSSRALLFAGAGLFGIQVFLLMRLRSVPDSAQLYSTAMVLCFASVGWWGLLVVSSGASAALPDIFLCVVVFGFGSLPWPLSVSFVFPALFLLKALDRGGPGTETGAFCIMILFAAAGALRGAAIQHLLLQFRVSLHSLRRAVDSGLATMPLLRLLGQEILTLSDSDNVLLMCGARHAYVIEPGKVKSSTVDQIFNRGLEEKIQAMNADEGVLYLKDLGRQFLPALADWFGSPAQRLLFFRTRAIVEEREESLIFILPVRTRFALVGTERIFRSIVCAVALVRASLAATRSRFLSSDVLLEAQSSVAEREHELGQIVHLVNNIAQDITIQCEGIGQKLGSSEPEKTAESVRLVETLARNLSSGVSDIKLQRELLRIGDLEQTDQADVEVVLEELRAYATYRRHRRGDTFEITNSVPQGAAVQVASREFLETGLRSLLRSSAARMAQGGKIKIDAQKRDDKIVFTISDNGAPGASSAGGSGKLAKDADPAVQREAQYFAAIAKLAERSGGSLIAIQGTGDFSHSIELALPVSRGAGNMRIEAGQWALLVDDNAQVTTFYSRVAEALSLKYFSAISVTEAEEMIERHGRPRIVITDIQLGAESGLDLVRSIRKKYGDSLPVIVVSGHTADTIAEEVSAAGASKFLSKPVGRAKLFAEIRALLAASVEDQRGKV